MYELNRAYHSIMQLESREEHHQLLRKEIALLQLKAFSKEMRMAGKSKELWKQCSNISHQIFVERKDLQENCLHDFILCLGKLTPFDDEVVPQGVCISCGHYFRLSSINRSKLLAHSNIIDVRGKISKEEIYKCDPLTDENLLVKKAREKIKELYIENPDLEGIDVVERIYDDLVSENIIKR